MFDETSSRSFDFTQALEDSPSRTAFDFTAALDETKTDVHTDPFARLQNPQWGSSDLLRSSGDRATNGGAVNSWLEAAGTGDEGHLQEEATPAGVVQEESAALPEEEDKNEAVIDNRFKGLKEFVQNYNWGRLARDGVHVLVPLLSGALATTILSPDQAHNLIVTAFGAGSAGFLGAGACAITEKILPRHLKVGRLASSLAVLRVTSAVFAEAGMLMGVGAISGVALHAREAFDLGMKLLNHDTLPAGNNNHTGIDSNPQFGGTSLDERDDLGRHFGGFSPDERGEVVQPPAGGGVGPDANPLTTPDDAPTIKPPLDPAGPESFPPTTDPAEAARIAALNQGQTVLEIATTMPQQTVSEAILNIIGDIPHGGEITNVIYRAAGEDIGKLHEGAIRELANSLSDLFSKADTAANNFGVPYDKGVLNAVNNTQSLGPNSSVANIIRAGNLGDMEAAAKIREEVFKPILQVLAK